MTAADLDVLPPLGLEHLQRLAALLAATPRRPSEYSLANLYLYRDRHDYRVGEGPCPFVRGRTYDGERHVMPLGPLDHGIAAALLEEGDCIFPLDEAEARLLISEGALAMDQEEADADYVYATARLARLDGAKAKRSQASAFAALSPEIVPFDGALARKVLAVWTEQVGRGGDHADARECAEALEQGEALALEGMAVSIRGEPVAFLLAGPERGGERTVHFAKARRDLVGAYPWMFAQFAAIAGVEQLNFEQDLGNPGLAQAKRALSPIDRRKKYRIRRRR